MAGNCGSEIREYVVVGTRRRLKDRNAGRRLQWESIFRHLQWPSVSRQKEIVRQVDDLSQSMLWNWDVSSAGDSTDVSFALGVDSSAAYEIICDKNYIRRSGIRRLQVKFMG